MLIKLEKVFDKFADFMGNLSAFLMVLMLLNVFYDVVMRYFFNSGSIGAQEMEWHLFSVIFLIGISYALKEDGHVRVDIIYDNLSYKKQALIDVVGTLFFLIPFALLICFGSLDFVYESYNTVEISGDPGGLTHRWIIKAFIPFSMALLVVTATGFILKNINLYRGTDGKKQDLKNAKEELK